MLVGSPKSLRPCAEPARLLVHANPIPYPTHSPKPAPRPPPAPLVHRPQSTLPRCDPVRHLASTPLLPPDPLSPPALPMRVSSNPPLPRVPKRPHCSLLRLARARPDADSQPLASTSTSTSTSASNIDRRPAHPTLRTAAPAPPANPRRLLGASEPILIVCTCSRSVGQTRIASTPAQGPSLVRNPQWHLRCN
ncbi:hypothetical protein L227DRAFT_574530 [Lentinus tigrinus ALCF2SS1-6]|uniref:Uncharacterized protein n=1 Tax=Lentinus tigrinus ALCF2SS1-6 TaxID=1328759 RepID=A0A5C2SCI1_9APHY|nr:hypothetical protein L227DRAFT_574530 [Lentinus tigrinus ALCF2SS1-6]